MSPRLSYSAHKPAFRANTRIQFTAAHAENVLLVPNLERPQGGFTTWNRLPCQ